MRSFHCLFVGIPKASKSHQQKRCFSDSLREWIASVQKKKVEQDDVVSYSLVRDLSYTLNRKDPTPKTGDVVPIGWHYIFFHPLKVEDELAEDGYDKDFSPPKPYIHRVWASEELRFEPQNPLRIGQSIQQTTVASNIELKEISRGESVFVTEHRKIFNEQGLSITSYRTLAYLSKPVSVSPPRPNPLPPVAAQLKREFTPTSVQLFRYSAVTFNSHKIHFDLDYVRNVEHYPSALVHGPFQSTMLLELFRTSHPDKIVKSWNYKAVSPMYLNGDSYLLCGNLYKEQNSCKLWTQNKSTGSITMTGTVLFE